MTSASVVWCGPGGVPLHADTRSTLHDGERRWPVVAGIPWLREGRDDVREQAVAALDAGDADGAGALIPADILRKFAFAGTPEDVAVQAAEILDAGAARVEFDTPFGLDCDRGLALLCDEVLPRVRAHMGG